ncbi:MAG: RagB/SusD family nutrient uptake outer membrane protein [Bacteroidia bacterium]|nr:RagB/SusD family nutrient uptake outer membrane protein [Bacteroidia bacterium]
MKKYSIIICTLLVLMSCSDFLGNQPKGEIIPQSIKHYDLWLNSSILVGGGSTHMNYLTDDVYVSTNGVAYSFGLNIMPPSYRNLYTFEEKVFSQSEDDSQWSSAYGRIHQYNTIMEKIVDATGGGETEIKKLQAEALLARAYDYLILVNTYAKQYDAATSKTDLGIPLLLTSVAPEGTLKRATVEEIYAQIIKDLTEAEKYLPERPTTGLFRGSKKAVYGTFARAYLIRGEYDKALSYANKLLERDKYLLDLKEYNIGVDNPETGYKAPTMEGRIVGIPEGKDNKECVYLKLDDSGMGVGMSAQILASEDLISLFDMENDKRFLLYYSNSFEGEVFNEFLYMPFIYLNLGISTPEMYLTAAECEARIGSKERALELLNALRDNRIINNEPLTAESNDEALTMVLEERRREFAMIGMFRFIDLRRLNKDPRFAKKVEHRVAKTELQEVTFVDEDGTEYKYMDYVEVGEPIIYTLEPNSPKYIMPIPPKVMRFNPGMPDNDRK